VVLWQRLVYDQDERTESVGKSQGSVPRLAVCQNLAPEQILDLGTDAVVSPVGVAHPEQRWIQHIVAEPCGQKHGDGRRHLSLDGAAGEVGGKSGEDLLTELECHIELLTRREAV
jgi:hypothetical protein